MTLVQIVALGTLPALASSTTPLADAAAAVHGRRRRGADHARAPCSRRRATTWGRRSSGSRNLFALAEQGDLPAVLRPGASAVPDAGQPRSSSRRRCRWCWRSSGRSPTLAPASAVSRLLVYVATCAATLRLRHPRFAGHGQPGDVHACRSGRVIPVARDRASRWRSWPARRREQLRAGVLALVVGAVLSLLPSRAGAEPLPELKLRPTRAAYPACASCVELPLREPAYPSSAELQLRGE